MIQAAVPQGPTPELPHLSPAWRRSSENGRGDLRVRVVDNWGQHRRASEIDEPRRLTKAGSERAGFYRSNLQTCTDSTPTSSVTRPSR